MTYMIDKFERHINEQKTERQSEIDHMFVFLNEDYNDKPQTKNALCKSLIMLLYSHWEWLIKSVTQCFFENLYCKQSIQKIPVSVLRYSLKNNFFQTDTVKSEEMTQKIIDFIINPNKSISTRVKTDSNLWFEAFIKIVESFLKQKKFITLLKTNSVIFIWKEEEVIENNLVFFLTITLLNFRNIFSHWSIAEWYNKEQIKIRLRHFDWHMKQ